MKVFNWVHRRFHNAHSCTNTFLQDDEVVKEKRSKIDNAKHLFLDEDGVNFKVDMFNQWNNGILAIGTLAINPLSLTMTEEADDDDDDLQQEVISHDHDHHNDDENHDEARPLMNVEYFSHEFEKVIGANHEIVEEVVDENVVIENIDNNEGNIKKRVTLADLFLEDREYYHPVKVLKELLMDDNCDEDDYINTNDDNQGLDKVIMKPACRTKIGLFKAKKLLKEDLHPLKKFNQLMKKMKKKKIHPDQEKKMHKDKKMEPSNGLTRRNPTNNQKLSTIS